MLKPIIAFFNFIHIVMVYFAKLLMIAMVLIIFANVVLRYGFNSGLVWSEEVALLLAVWFIFIAMSLGVKQRLHIHITLFASDRIPAWLDRALWQLRNIIVMGVGIVMLLDGQKLVGFTMRSIMPATNWPAGLMYAVLPVSAVIIIYETLTDIFNIDTRDEQVDLYLSGSGSLKEVFGGKDA